VLLAIKNRGRNRPCHSEGGIAGEVGEVIKDVHRHAKGIVRVRSELWSAKSEGHVPSGASVRVTRVEGLLTWVEKMEEAEP
jgi:membrane-bound ClpP family serine protease